MAKDYRQMSFRISDVMQLKELCHVRSAGHFIVKPGFRGIPMHKYFLELFWGVAGSGNIKYGDQIVSLKPGETFWYFPGDYHDVYADDTTWEYYWITFDGPDMDALVRTYGLTHTLQKSGPCPVKLFEDIIVSLLKIDLESAVQTSVRGYEILERAVNGAPETTNDMASNFRKLVEKNFGNVDFSIDGAANELGIHRSSLHRIFLAESGVSPQEYLLAFRIQQAVNLLATNMNIKNIAEACGFSCTNYWHYTSFSGNLN